MPAFSVSPITDIPAPQAESFPNFIQFQASGENLGGADADTLNFSTGLTATRGTGENSDVVTLTAAGGASYGVIRLSRPPDPPPGAFDLVPFAADWQSSVLVENAGWSFADGALTFAETGIYRVVATCTIQPDGNVWPVGVTYYGSIIGASRSFLSRFYTDYELVYSNTVQWTDQHVLTIDTEQTAVDCRLYAYATATDYAVAAVSMTLVVERLGDLPA